MPAPATAPMLLVLAGPSGSGKSTLCDRLADADLGFRRVVTATTREPREGEQNGIHYHFFTPAEFEAKVAAGEFLEWAWVHGRRRYGTLAASVRDPLRAGQDLVMSVDVQGVENFRRAAAVDPLLRKALCTVFIMVDRKRLLERMRGRGQDDEAEIARRMATADAETLEAPKFDSIIQSRTRDEDFAVLRGIVDKMRQKSPGSA